MRKLLRPLNGGVAIEARMGMGLAVPKRQTELVAGQLADVGAERAKMAQEKFLLVEENAVRAANR